MGSLVTDIAGLLISLGEASDGGSAGASWPVFEDMIPPDDPDMALAVFSLPGLPPSPFKAEASFPQFQIRVRSAPAQPAPARLKIESILAELSGYSGTLDGTRYTHVFPLSSAPFPLGKDDRGRYEYTISFQCDKSFP
jgi:Bacteriophage minor capsid protein